MPEGTHSDLGQSEEDEYINTAQAVELCGVSRVTLLRWVKQGRVTRYRRPNKQGDLYKKADIKQMMEIQPVEIQKPRAS